MKNDSPRRHEFEVKLPTLFSRRCSGHSAFADAELVALDVSQHRPGVPPLILRSDDGGTQADEALHLGRRIIRHQIDMHPVLAGLALGDLCKEPIGRFPAGVALSEQKPGDSFPSVTAEARRCTVEARVGLGRGTGEVDPHDHSPQGRLVHLA